MPRVFLSYRRRDSAGHAGRLYDDLVEAFGSENIFMDVDSIDIGSDFAKRIEESVGGCDALIALIGDEWLNDTDRTGRRRLDDPADFVRMEIATAIRAGVRIVPALVAGAEMPVSEDLPADLQGLLRRHAVELSDSRWDYDVKRMIEALRAIDSAKGAAAAGSAARGSTTPGPGTPPAGGGAKRAAGGGLAPIFAAHWKKLAAGVIVAVAAALALVLVLGGSDDSPSPDPEALLYKRVNPPFRADCKTHPPGEGFRAPAIACGVPDADYTIIEGFNSLRAMYRAQGSRGGQLPQATEQCSAKVWHVQLNWSDSPAGTARGKLHCYETTEGIEISWADERHYTLGVIGRTDQNRTALVRAWTTVTQ